jgi:hypothetical protein
MCNTKTVILKFIVVLLALILVSCKTKQEKVGTKKLVSDTTVVVSSVNLAGSPSQIRIYPLDTLLESGWNIRYYTKNDSSRNSDLYIECSKSNKKFVYKAYEVLQLRSYFIPTFVGESQSCIYFTTACATNCESLLVFNKHRKPGFRLYNSVIDYSISNDIIAFINADMISSRKYMVSVASGRDNTVKSIHFRNYCNVLPREGCVDSIRFTGSEVSVFATLNEGKDYYKDKVAKEQYMISLSQ